MKAQIPWLRVFVEGVVIVGSILLALGLDAWWDGVQDRQEEQRILAALGRDFEETRANVMETVASTEEVRDTVIRLLDIMSGDLALVPEEELRDLVRGSFWFHRFEPRISTYQDLVNSGNLRLIGNDSLRTAMALLVEDLDDADSAVEMIVTRWATMEEPYLVHDLAP